MNLDSALLIAFLAAFLRTSAMVLAAPLFTGTGTPVMVRVFFAAGLSLALTPVIHGQIPVPASLYDLAALGFVEIATGLLLGFCVQMIMLAAEIAGSFLDIQVGFGLSSILAPNTIMPATVISRFKFMLAMMLFLSLNGHHILMSALAESYASTSSITLAGSFEVLMLGVGRMFMLSMQIAAPVAAVAFVVDAALGIVSRAVPQINVLMAGISGKLLAGMIALSFALPGLAYCVSKGIEYTGDLMHRLVRS